MLTKPENYRSLRKRRQIAGEAGQIAEANVITEQGKETRSGD